MVKGAGRSRRWLLVLAAVVLALAAAATWGPGLLNLERYRAQIARQAGHAIGREVSVGAIAASFWHLGAEARGIRVAERPGFGQAPFVEADALRVGVELLPLLHGQVRVASAVLERPRIHLLRDREGHWNIQDLLAAAGPGTAAAPPGRPGAEPSRPSRPAAAAGLLVRELRARGGEVRIDDLRPAPASAASLALRNLRLDVRQGEPVGTFMIRMAGEVSGGALDGTATLALRGNSPTVDARAGLTGFDLSALEAYLGVGMASGPANLTLTAKGALPGPGNGSPAGLDLTGELDLARARLALGALAPKAPGEEARLTFAGRLVGEGIELPKVRVRWRGAEVEGRVSVVRFQPLEATFAADSPRLDLDHLLAPPSATQPAAGKRARWPGLFGAAVAWASPPPRSAGPARAREAPTGGAPSGRAGGPIRVGAVRWHGAEARDVRATLAYRDAVLAFRDVTGGLFGGRLAAAGSLDLRGRYPALLASARLVEAQLQPLVAAVSREKGVQAQGVLTGEGKVSSPALGPGNILGTLVGSGNFVVRDGRVTGYKPLERLGGLLGGVPGGAGPLKARLDEFQRLSATFTLDKGFLRTPDLTLLRPDGQAKMAGSMNLLNKSLDFNATVQLGKVTVEAKVMGTTDDPLVVPTVARLNKRFDLEFDRSTKGDRGKKIQDLLRNLLQ